MSESSGSLHAPEGPLDGDGKKKGEFSSELHDVLEKAAKEDDWDTDQKLSKKAVEDKRRKSMMQKKKSLTPLVRKLSTKTSAGVQNKAGETALHLGLRTKAPLDCIKHMLQADPASAQVEDSNQRLPLHVAVHCQADLLAIKALLKAHEEAIEKLHCICVLTNKKLLMQKLQLQSSRSAPKQRSPETRGENVQSTLPSNSMPHWQ